MSEYEKASLLFLATMTEYLHIVAWANRNGDTNGKRVAQAAQHLGERLKAECPEAVAVLTGARS